MEPKRLGVVLRHIWERQKDYNRTVIRSDGTDPDAPDRHFWSKQYLLGLISEVDEVLDMLRWKRHRRNKTKVIRHNLAMELADLTKYVMSLWQIWDFDVEEVLEHVNYKNVVLEEQWRMEHTTLPEKVLLCDMDGTLVDYRAGLLKFLQEQGYDPDLTGREEHYAMDLALALGWTEYHTLKDQFEEGGGYNHYMPPYPDTLQPLLHRQQDQIGLVVVTARPQYLSRTWGDSLSWLRKQRISVDRLHLTGSERLSIAIELREQGHDVVVWDDEPLNCQRFAEEGFPVFMRDQPYNQGLEHPNIKRINQFGSLLMDCWRYKPGWWERWLAEQEEETPNGT